MKNSINIVIYFLVMMIAVGENFLSSQSLEYRTVDLPSKHVRVADEIQGLLNEAKKDAPRFVSRVRRCINIGVPCLVATALAGLIWFCDNDNQKKTEFPEEYLDRIINYAVVGTFTLGTFLGSFMLIYAMLCITTKRIQYPYSYALTLFLHQWKYLRQDVPPDLRDMLDKQYKIFLGNKRILSMSENEAKRIVILIIKQCKVLSRNEQAI